MGFFNNSEFTEHTKTHAENCTALKSFNCTVCKDLPTIPESKYLDHLNWHLQDRARCVYIYTCKYCRSFFRSTATYAVHRRRCAKSEKTVPVLPTTLCHFCAQKIVFKEKETYKTCSICKKLNYAPNFGPIDKNSDGLNGDEKKSVMCMLCKEEVANEDKKAHYKTCKYNNPVVSMSNIPNDTENSEIGSDKLSSTNSDVESKPSALDTSNDSLKTDENTPKKRKKNGKFATKSKRVASEDRRADDLQAGEPIDFDGTYYCKVCEYKNGVREEFHSHIMTHRDVSTAYQCMECGQCFMVKPSLIKHLVHYHKISDAAAYLAKNNCYDKFAIEELHNNLKAVPGMHKGPVKENQCTVCLEQFDDSLALKKHFRVHGLAFVMKQI